MNEEQWTTCEATVGKVTEVRIGYDGITFSTRLENTGFEDLTPEQIYLALSDKSEAATWADVDASLPALAIKAFIPGTKHGTREVFETKVMLAGCKAVGTYDEVFAANGGDKKAAEKECFKVRTVAHLWTSMVITQKHWRRWMPTQRGSVSLACHSC